jgi:putative transposase
MLETTRTYVAKITNHGQVRGDLNQCGFSASKLWNVGRYYIQQRWDDDGEVPEEAALLKPSSLEMYSREYTAHYTCKNSGGIPDSPSSRKRLFRLLSLHRDS